MAPQRFQCSPVVVRGGILCLAWYIVSTTIIFTNKWLLSNRGFTFPFLMTMVNNLAVSLVAKLVTYFPGMSDGIELVTWRKYIRVVVPIGVFTAIDIAASNWALEYLSVSFHTMIKGTVPGFVLLFGLVFGLETPTRYLIGSVSVVCLGIMLATYGAVDFHAFGFFLVVLACTMAGLRWALTQILMRDTERHTSPLATILQVSPVCAASMVPLFLGFEARDLVESDFARDASAQSEVAGALLCISLLVFLLLMCEFGLVHLASSLTLSVAGIFKELLTILLAMAVFHDHVSTLNAVGFVISVMGIMMYNCHRFKESSEAAVEVPHEFLDDGGGDVAVTSNGRGGGGGGSLEMPMGGGKQSYRALSSTADDDDFTNAVIAPRELEEIA